MNEFLHGNDVQKIIEALNSFSEPRITGAKLALLIREQAPSLKVRDVVGIPYGPGALSEFARIYLSDVLQHSGKQGGDILYTIKHTSSSSEGSHRIPAGALWTAFIKPTDTQTIILIKKTLEFMIAPAGQNTLGDDSVAIESLSPDELHSIQAEFMAAIEPGSGTDPIVETLRAAESNVKWFNILKHNRPADFSRWLNYRRERIFEIFLSRLASIGLNTDSINRLTNELKQSQRDFAALRAKGKELTDMPVPRKDRITNEIDEALFRRGLIAALSNMSIEELRQLPLPYGAVFDALTKHSK